MRLSMILASALLLTAGSATAAVLLPSGHSTYVELRIVRDTGPEWVLGQAPCDASPTARLRSYLTGTPECFGAGYVWAYPVAMGRPWEGRVLAVQDAALIRLGGEGFHSVHVVYDSGSGVAEAMAAHIATPVDTGEAVVNFALPVPMEWDGIAYERGPAPATT